MAYRYKVPMVTDDNLQSKLDEWTAAGWELFTATCGVSGHGKFYHYLYFRREQ
jgi:hypothetical protein